MKSRIQTLLPLALLAILAPSAWGSKAKPAAEKNGHSAPPNAADDHQDPGQLSEEQFRKRLGWYLAEFTEPLEKLLSEEREKILRETVPKCRRTKPLQSCLATGDSDVCAKAMSCPFKDERELQLMRTYQQQAFKRLDDMRSNFTRRLPKHRRGFSNSVVNRLIDFQNETTEGLNALMQVISSRMAEKCIPKTKEVTPEAERVFINCQYGQLETLYSRAADVIKNKRGELKRLVNEELMYRIRAYRNTPELKIAPPANSTTPALEK